MFCLELAGLNETHLGELQADNPEIECLLAGVES